MVRASGLRGYEALMRQLGADATPLLRRYRIAAESLGDEDALLPLRSVVQLIEASAAATDCADFGLRLAQRQDISVLGPLAIVMQNAPTVKEAMEYASRYLFVHSPGLVLTLHERSLVAPQCVELRFELRLAQQASQRQTIDLCLGDIHHMVRLLAGERYLLQVVTLPHAPLAPMGAYRRFFGAPVRMEQPYAGLHIASATLETGLQAVNHTLRQLAMDYLAQHFQAPGESLTARVRQGLRRTLGTPQGNKDDIAGLLGMHPRTLQRRLTVEGTTYEAIREEIRREMALRYLTETKIPLAQLAGMLGYSEQSAFARSCRRWFGMPPSRMLNRDRR